MKRGLATCILASLCFAFLFAGRAQGSGSYPEATLPLDGQQRTLAPDDIAWYQFEYRGDKTQINVRLTADAVPDIDLALYTPGQIEAWRQGDGLRAVGQAVRRSGSPARDLMWSGSFNQPGTYYVTVHNPTRAVIVYQLVVDGVSVKNSQVAADRNLNPEPNRQNYGSGAENRSKVGPEQQTVRMPPALTSSSIPINFPAYMGMPPSNVSLAARPSHCTPAAQMPAVANRSIALCPGEVYRPFRVGANNVTIYGDPSAVVVGPARGFAITVTGRNVAIVGVRIEAATFAGDLNKWLCLYELCTYNTMYQNESVRGGVAYGGGILLQNTANAAVVGSSVRGGTIGVASAGGTQNRIFNNDLSNLNGWGVFLHNTNGDYVIGNTMNYVNRPCIGPDGYYYQSGCESAAVSCVACQASIIVSNRCEHSGNCYYATGEGGQASNNNKYFDNYCAAAANNCFEITYSQGNQFDYNVATFDPNTREACTYPFWIAGSIVYFGRHNTWACARSINQAIHDSEDASSVPTEVRQL